MKLPALNVEFLPVTPANRIAAINEGKADLECGSTTNTRERRKQVDFSIAYFIASARMVVRADSGIRNWSDLRNRKIVTTKGTTNAQTLVDRDKVRSLNITLMESRDHAEAFSMVERGQADAFAMDDVLLYALRASSRNPTDFLVAGDSLSTEPYAIMLGKDDPEFKRIVDREVARVMNDGEIYALYDRWFKQPIPPHGINMNMPMGYLLRASIRYPSDKVAD
jgi:glutamate/aspartate transport system substrate-binding protein